MDMRKPILLSVAAFAAFGLLGPLIQRAFWAPANFLLLIWPTLVLGSGGTARTLQHDLTMTAGLNVAFFAFAGLLIASIATRKQIVLWIYIAVCALVLLAEAWGAGFSLSFFSWRNVVGASLLYSLPFGVVWWARNHALQRVPKQSL